MKNSISIGENDFELREVKEENTHFADGNLNENYRFLNSFKARA